MHTTSKNISKFFGLNEVSILCFVSELRTMSRFRKFTKLRGCIQKFPDWVKTNKLTKINTCWEAIQRVMVSKLTRLTHKIAMQLHLVAESCATCSSHCRRSVRKLLDTRMFARQVNTFEDEARRQTVRSPHYAFTLCTSCKQLIRMGRFRAHFILRHKWCCTCTLTDISCVCNELRSSHVTQLWSHLNF
jgi:hypothetical protein